MFKKAKYINNNKRLTESVIFHEVDSDEVEDILGWAILDNDKWFAKGDGLILQETRLYNELIFSKNHENAIHEALEELQDEELIEELKRITGLDYVEDSISDYHGNEQKIYYPVGTFNKKDIAWFSDVYFGNYTAYATVDENVDPQYVWVFDSDKRRPEEIIAADTGLPVSEVVIKKIKGYKQVPIYEAIDSNEDNSITDIFEHMLEWMNDNVMYHIKDKYANGMYFTINMKDFLKELDEEYMRRGMDLPKNPKNFARQVMAAYRKENEMALDNIRWEE